MHFLRAKSPYEEAQYVVSAAQDAVRSGVSCVLFTPSLSFWRLIVTLAEVPSRWRTFEILMFVAYKAARTPFHRNNFLLFLNALNVLSDKVCGEPGRARQDVERLGENEIFNAERTFSPWLKRALDVYGGLLRSQDEENDFFERDFLFLKECCSLVDKELKQDLDLLQKSWKTLEALKLELIRQHASPIVLYREKTRALFMRLSSTLIPSLTLWLPESESLSVDEKNPNIILAHPYTEGSNSLPISAIDRALGRYINCGEISSLSVVALDSTPFISFRSLHNTLGEGDVPSAKLKVSYHAAFRPPSVGLSLAYKGTLTARDLSDLQTNPYIFYARKILCVYPRRLRGYQHFVNAPHFLFIHVLKSLLRAKEENITANSLDDVLLSRKHIPSLGLLRPALLRAIEGVEVWRKERAAVSKFFTSFVTMKASFHEDILLETSMDYIGLSAHDGLRLSFLQGTIPKKTINFCDHKDLALQIFLLHKKLVQLPISYNAIDDITCLVVDKEGEVQEVALEVDINNLSEETEEGIQHLLGRAQSSSYAWRWRAQLSDVTYQHLARFSV